MSQRIPLHLRKPYPSPPRHPNDLHPSSLQSRLAQQHCSHEWIQHFSAGGKVSPSSAPIFCSFFQYMLALHQNHSLSGWFQIWLLQFVASNAANGKNGLGGLGIHQSVEDYKLNKTKTKAAHKQYFKLKFVTHQTFFFLILSFNFLKSFFLRLISDRRSEAFWLASSISSFNNTTIVS